MRLIIQQIWGKCKTEWFVGLIFILGLSLAFGLGRLSILKPPKSPVTITNPATNSLSAVAVMSVKNNLTMSNKNGDAQGGVGEVVASKQGSKYHLPTCSGAKRIKPENLVTYESVAAAQAAGLTPAANCPGL